MTLSRFHVAGMDCAAEEQLVRIRLAGFNQIERIAVDLDQRQVTIQHAGDTAKLDAALRSLDLGSE